MVNWSNALIVAIAGLASVFAVLILLMLAMQASGSFMKKLGPKKEK